MAWPHSTAPVDQQARRSAEADLEHVDIIEQRYRVLGYEREQFGSGWGQALDLATGHACSTRELVLSSTFHTDDCGEGDGRTKLGVEINDPYTGALITAEQVDIDHVYPLSAAWDMGAWRWDRARRQKFANDTTLNLVAVGSEINREKSDLTLGDWLPPDSSAHCAYAARFLRIAVVYELSVSQSDAEVARHACQI